MYIIAILSSLLLPPPVLACSMHDFAARAAGRPTVSILFNLILILIISTPLGLYAGFGVRRLTPAFRKFLFVLAVGGVSAIGSIPTVSACHGHTAVAPFLEKVYAAEMKYSKLHGIYAASFDELGFAPESEQYSFFLPSQSLPAKNVSPRPGIDLGTLPEGVHAVVSAKAFTVVAIGFAEPNRIDVWTMNEKNDFREWSVSAERPLPQKPAVAEPEGIGHTIAVTMENFEGTLMLVALLLGLALGLSLSFAWIGRPTESEAV